MLEAIEEAVAVYRRLRAGDPWAYEPGLAVSLHNVAPGLRRVARNQDALAAIKEAVTMQRRLATCNPTAHEPILATTLGSSADCLGDLGRRREALAAIEEAVSVRRRLAATDGLQLDLSRSLNNLSVSLGAGRCASAGHRSQL